MTKQIAFYFDQRYCIGCMACQIACKDKNDLWTGQRYRKVKEITDSKIHKTENSEIPSVYAFWTSISCNHCLEPSCIPVCPTGALKKRLEDGIVIVDEDLCIGCKKCIKSCPYESPQFNQETGKIGKCDFCLDLISKGEIPACIASCPMRVLDYGPLSELQEKYGLTASTLGLPASSLTQPALVITPHRDAK